MVGRNTFKSTSKAARTDNNEQAEDSHATLRGELSQAGIIKKQADQIAQLAMANREMTKRFVRMEQCLEQVEPAFGHQREALGLQRLVAYANGSKRPMGEPHTPTTSVFECVGRPAEVTSYSIDRALSMASSSNNPRPLVLHRRPANQKAQCRGFHQARREDRRRNSWAELEGGQSWQGSDPTPRWRENEWIEQPCQPLRDRHPEVEELVRIPSPRPKLKNEYRPTNPRPTTPV